MSISSINTNVWTWSLSVQYTQEADTCCTIDGQVKISLFMEEIHSQDQNGQSKSTT